MFACPPLATLGVQARQKDTEIADALPGRFRNLASPSSRNVRCSALEGGCQVPLGAWARFERGELVMDAVVVRPMVRKRAVNAQPLLPTKRANHVSARRKCSSNLAPAKFSKRPIASVAE
jgi:porphobilinogen deaminase